MSTNINHPNLPDLGELEQLANQFFKALPADFPAGGAFPSAQPELPQADNLLQQTFAPDPALLNLSPQANTYEYARSPKSVAGSGVSRSAVNEGNAVNINSPQTGFDDPSFRASNSSVNSPFPHGASPSAQEAGAAADHLKQPDVPFKNIQETFPVGEQVSSAPVNLNYLPYQQQQPFEIELQRILPSIQPAGFGAQLPFDAPSVSPYGYYFLNEPAPTAAIKPSNESKKVGITQLITTPFDVNLVRRDFPILQEYVNGKQLIWLDNAATTQKPRRVIDRISYFYEHENSNIHRAAHELAARATDAYEGARKKVQSFLNAGSVNEIVFVRGATEAINLVAKSWGEQNLHVGDEIIVSNLEHHANIVPWQQLAAKKGLKIKVIPVDDDGQIILDEYTKLLGPKTKLVAFTQVSNALGTVTPATQIVQLAHLAGAKVLVDGAQSVSHMRVDVRALDADWFVFSGHKVFGPTGIGVLYGKEALLNETQPWQGGGNMIVDVTFEHTQYHNAPSRFEAGTGNIADAVGLGAAIDYVTRLGMDAIAQYEHYLLEYATALIKDVPGIRLIGTAPDKASVLSFVLAGYKTEDVGAELNKEGIAVRSGHHCAQPILRRFGVESTVRPSLAFYNTCAEIDVLVNTLYRLAR